MNCERAVNRNFYRKNKRFFKGIVVQIEKALINDHLCVSKVSFLSFSYVFEILHSNYL